MFFFSRRIRQLAERSDYFRSELRSMQHQTWFLPTDQAFSSMGSSLSSLLDQSSMNNTNDINEVRFHSFHFNDFFIIRFILVHSSTCFTYCSLSKCDGFNQTSGHFNWR